METVKEGTDLRALRELQMIVLLGKVISSREIESEAQFFAAAFSVAEIPFTTSWDSLGELDSEKAWNCYLPSEIQRGFLPILLKSKSIDLDKAWVEVCEFLSENEESSPDTAARAFERKIPPAGVDTTSYEYFVFLAWQRAHRAFDKSIQHLMEHPAFALLLSSCSHPEATKRELFLWYTSQGPWKDWLGGCVPALRGAIPSLYGQLSSVEKDEFDRTVFVEGKAPPLYITKKLLMFAATFADRYAELKDYDAWKHHQDAHKKGVATKFRRGGEVRYDSKIHDFGQARPYAVLRKGPLFDSDEN
ncbi:hypothetical protein WDW37_13955 [Bdellovibrionota bacterium FG-1]